jgi:hypothetical protein
LAFSDLLPPDDFFAIADLRGKISQKYQRGARVEHFHACLMSLLAFVEQDGEQSWRRALVCGVCQVDGALAANNARLQAFTRFSKSSINDFFARMRYRPVALNRANQAALAAKIPRLQTHRDEARQWTYRVRDSAPARALSPLLGIPGPRAAPAAPDPGDGACDRADVYQDEWDLWGDADWV